MKRTLFIVLAILILAPAALRGQDSESLYNGWSAGFQLGVGGMIPTGSLGDDLKGSALFTGGLTAGYNRARLKVDLNYCQPSFKNENPYAVYDASGRDLQRNGTASATLLGVGCQLGYTVWRSGRVSVTPCVGVIFNRLNWDMNTIKWETDEQGEEKPKIDDVAAVHENSTGWMASVDIDIRLKGKFVDVGGNSHYTSGLRLSPFIAHAGYSNLSPSVKGSWIGLTVNYTGLFRFINQ